jgi:hypothetical protein
MLKLKNIIHFPAYYKEHNLKLDNIDVTSIKIEKIEGKYEINAKSGKHDVKIEFTDEKLTTDTDIKVFCGCESFKFEFAHALYIKQSLLDAESFKMNLERRGKKKNVYAIPSGCKHVVAVGQYIFRNLEKFQKEIDKL